MQDELDTDYAELGIAIHGVNEEGLQDSNQTITDGRSLPWLQDTAAEAVWDSWGVDYRDVYILDSENYVLAVMNLTTTDLGEADNYQALLDMMVEAAAFTPE